MKRLLNFIDVQKSEDNFTGELAEAVQFVRNNDYKNLHMSY